ncbi:MAG: DUF4160 domain-containing protein [Tannerella sp.]|nr:DUF4160 domain-containing protein [Tannerella sp.]
MYYEEHIPPHIHVYFQGAKAAVNIQDGSLLAGKLSPRNNRLIQAWIEIHRDELLADWELCQNGEHPFFVEPLK